MLDLSFVRDLAQGTYADTGRPSIDPIVFFKLQLVLFFEDTRSERLLMRLVADKLSVRWYLGFNLDDPLPHHSSLTRIRTRYGLAVFRRFFPSHCRTMLPGLSGGGSCISMPPKSKRMPRWIRCTRASVSKPISCRLFGPELAEETPTPTEPSTAESGPTPLPVPLTASEQEALATANAQRHDWIARAGAPNREEVRGSYRRIADFRVSTTDPDATMMPTKGQGLHLGYHLHYVVDGG